MQYANIVNYTAYGGVVQIRYGNYMCIKASSCNEFQLSTPGTWLARVAPIKSLNNGWGL